MFLVLTFFVICLIGAVLATREMVLSRPANSLPAALVDFGWLFLRLVLAAGLASLTVLLPFLLMY